MRNIKQQTIKETDYNTFKEYYDKTKNSINEDWIKDRFKKFKNGNMGNIYKHILKFILLEDIKEKQGLSYYKINLNNISHIVLQEGKKLFYVCLNGLNIRNISKVSSKRGFSYLSNGQINKGKLKGNKKDRKMIKEIKEYWRNEKEKIKYGGMDTEVKKEVIKQKNKEIQESLNKNIELDLKRIKIQIKNILTDRLKAGIRYAKKGDVVYELNEYKNEIENNKEYKFYSFGGSGLFGADDIKINNGNGYIAGGQEGKAVLKKDWKRYKEAIKNIDERAKEIHKRLKIEKIEKEVLKNE